MLTAENIALFIVAVVVALAIAIIYDRLHVGSMDYRESRIEDEVKQLRQRVEALQATIDLMSGFTTEQSLNRRRQALAEYAEKQNKIELLRSAILTINPAAFG